MGTLPLTPQNNVLTELQGGACQPHQLAAALHIPDFPKTKEADIDGGGTTAGFFIAEDYDDRSKWESNE